MTPQRQAAYVPLIYISTVTNC